MYTQCPQCDTIFRVNAALLRAAQGQVRCGVCDATFDAIRFLMDEIESGASIVSASQIHFEPPATAEAPPLGHEPAGLDVPDLPSAQPLSLFETDDAANEWWVQPVDGGGDAPVTRAADHQDTLTGNPWAVLDPSLPTDPDTLAPLAATATEEAPIAAMEAPLADPADRLAAEDDERRPAGQAPARSASALVAVAALLSLALAAQWLHAERDVLATHPLLGPPLTAAYQALGIDLLPRWDLAAYDIRDWKAAPDAAAQTIRLHARIANRAPVAQPWPLLRVVFEDRYGGIVGRRDFKPAEYLPNHATGTVLLPPGQQIEADLALVDPGSQVVSYQIDACLPLQNVIGCGSDVKGSHVE